MLENLDKKEEQQQQYKKKEIVTEQENVCDLVVRNKRTIESVSCVGLFYRGCNFTKTVLIMVKI